MTIHEASAMRLVEVLEECLPKLTVSHGAFLNLRSADCLARLDSVLPGPTSQLRTSFARYLSDEPASDFVIGELMTELMARPYISDSESTPLTHVPGYEDPKAVATRLVSAFDSLPWRYELLAPVPHLLREPFLRAIGSTTTLLCSGLSLFAPAAEQDAFPVARVKTRSILLSEEEITLDPAGLYFRSAADGYIPEYGGSSPLDAFLLALRGFYGIGIALRLFTTGAIYSPSPRPLRLLVYRTQESGLSFAHLQEAPPDTASLIHSMGLDASAAKHGPEFIDYLFRENAPNFAIAFSSAPLDDNKLIRSAAWLFDSYAGHNRLLNFVQAAVSLEILLGDKATSDLTGLGELLANRCAYLVGTSRRQRAKIIADFRRIYDTRSRIVHRGHSRLSAAESKDLSLLRWLAGRVIQEEVRLAKADTPE